MLRLGFLDSQALSTGTGPKDAAFVASSRDTASARLAAASHAHALDSERDSEETVRWKVIRKRGWKLDNQINNDIKTSRHWLLADFGLLQESSRAMTWVFV